MVEFKIDVVVVDMPILDTRKHKKLGGVGQLVTNHSRIFYGGARIEEKYIL
nr:hypothetical protein [Brevibacillus laterosporus]